VLTLSKKRKAFVVFLKIEFKSNKIPWIWGQFLPPILGKNYHLCRQFSGAYVSVPHSKTTWSLFLPVRSGVLQTRARHKTHTTFRT